MIYIYAFLFAYVLFEGLREYYFYKVNKAGGFPDRASDLDRKNVNVVTFLLFVIVLMYISASGLPFLIFSVSLRWLAIDVTLNLTRGLNAFYVGSVAKTDVVVRWMAKKLNMNMEVLSAILKITWLAASIYLLIVC